MRRARWVLWIVGGYVAATLAWAAVRPWLVPALVLSLLASCAHRTIYVTNADGSRPEARQFERDQYECDRDSALVLRTPQDARRMYVSCLKARGYLVHDRDPAQR